jgi:hypothetical protein
VRKKHEIAFSGLCTIGSCKLKLVLSVALSGRHSRGHRHEGIDLLDLD